MLTEEEATLGVIAARFIWDKLNMGKDPSSYLQKKFLIISIGITLAAFGSVDYIKVPDFLKEELSNYMDNLKLQLEKEKSIN